MSSIQKPTRGGRQSFLSWVDTGERLVARILALITGVVIISALLKLVLSLSTKLLTGSEATWLGDDLIKVLGDLLTVLIALEVLQNITSYLRRHVVQIELVLVTALTAVARKVIVLPSGAENKPQLLVGLGIAVAALAAAYWLVKRANTTPAKASQDQDRFAPPDADDWTESTDGHRG